MGGIAALLGCFPVFSRAALQGNAGDLYVSGQHANLIYEVNPTTGAIVGSVSSNGGTALGIRFDSQGNLLAVDYDTGSLEKYNGTTGAHIGTVGSGIDDAYGLTVCNNQYYVSSSLGQAIDVFNTSGTLVHTITSPDFSNLPLGMVVSPANRLLVGTRNGSQIDSFNSDGSSPSLFATNSNIGDGFGLAYGPNGNLYESNAGTNSILEFNGTTGAYISSITGSGLNSPVGIAFDPTGKLYVANSGDNSISVFGSNGALLSNFTGFGGIYDLTFKSTAVPEPACISLLVSGCAALLARRRRAQA